MGSAMEQGEPNISAMASLMGGGDSVADSTTVSGSGGTGVGAGAGVGLLDVLRGGVWRRSVSVDGAGRAQGRPSRKQLLGRGEGGEEGQGEGSKEGEKDFSAEGNGTIAGEWPAAEPGRRGEDARAQDMGLWETAGRESRRVEGEAEEECEEGEEEMIAAEALCYGPLAEVNLGGHVHTRMRMLHLLPHALPSLADSWPLPADQSSVQAAESAQGGEGSGMERGREAGDGEAAAGGEGARSGAVEEQQVLPPLKSPSAARLFSFGSPFLFFTSTPRPSPAPAATAEPASLPAAAAELPAPELSMEAPEATPDPAPATACPGSSQSVQPPPAPAGTKDSSSPVSPLDPLPADAPPAPKSFLLPPFLPAKPLPATSGVGPGNAGVGAFLRRPLLFFRTLSLQERGEPLLHKAYGEEGGDEIDWDRRKALEAEQEHPLYKQPSEEQKAASESQEEPVSPSASSVRELFGDEFRVGHWERRQVDSRDGGARLCAEVFLASVDQCHASAAGEGACALLVAHIAAWVHAHGVGVLPGQAELDELIRAGSADWRRLRGLRDFHQRFPDGHFDLETVLDAVQHTEGGVPADDEAACGGETVSAEAKGSGQDTVSGESKGLDGTHGASSSSSSSSAAVTAPVQRLPLRVVPSRSFVGFFHPPSLAARRAKQEEEAERESGGGAEADAADVCREGAGRRTVEGNDAGTEETGGEKDGEVAEECKCRTHGPGGKGKDGKGMLGGTTEQVAGSVEPTESSQGKALQQLSLLEGLLSFDDIWDAVVRAGEGVYIVAWNDHFFLLLLRHPHPQQRQQGGGGAEQVATNVHVGEKHGESRGKGGTGEGSRSSLGMEGEVVGGEEVECVVIDTLGERLHEGCSQAFMLRFDASTWVDVGRAQPGLAAQEGTAGEGAAAGSTGGEETAQGKGGDEQERGLRADGAGSKHGSKADKVDKADKADKAGEAEQAVKAEDRAGGTGVKGGKSEAGRRWGMKVSKSSGKAKRGSEVDCGAEGERRVVECGGSGAAGAAEGVGRRGDEGAAAHGVHVAVVTEAMATGSQPRQGTESLPANSDCSPGASTTVPQHVISQLTDNCPLPFNKESASTAAESTPLTALHAAESACPPPRCNSPSQTPRGETCASTTILDGWASNRQPTHTSLCTAGSSPSSTTTTASTSASPPTSPSPPCAGEGEAATLATARRVWGAEACREYLKAFLAAVPLAEVESEASKGLLASPEAILRRLQVEFHFTHLQ
ncbi:hypothetical protein CLOM_g22757 [Closterium sp. NIES-68]|nr:hypothetical protein CLOM_g22757 [Closterium sp. NIES-68]GJP60572.1 hypothetical protein CLOP_g17812 [Closterium sp. NIES-67]